MNVRELRELLRPTYDNAPSQEVDVVFHNPEEVEEDPYRPIERLEWCRDTDGVLYCVLSDVPE